jgi:hypothetical protein
MLHWDYHHATLASSQNNEHYTWDHHQTSALPMIPLSPPEFTLFQSVN